MRASNLLSTIVLADLCLYSTLVSYPWIDVRCADADAVLSPSFPASHFPPLPLAFYLHPYRHLRPGLGTFGCTRARLRQRGRRVSPLSSLSRRSHSWKHAPAAAVGEPSTPKMRAPRIYAGVARIRVRVRAGVHVGHIF
ncbi:hypothetical protein B0H11DRAFT_869749 [Mycena galericulata]|nr:hypothetical protein B0H11DRAFT_869749 [Mycena galericulata]